MEKIEVASGISLVNIPEAGLHILCGSPADSVKHLMKKGLIVTVEKGGVVYETGPNAIILADTPLQKESFANLSEFPVLQMLYRQGTIIPGHPNNTGLRPMIIGGPKQVAAQMDYILRGNYGLISREELMAAGIPEPRATELMRMKLAFAFGKIRNSDELLETRIVDSDPVELRNGVFIRRLAVNVFELAYGGTSLTIDLNLKTDEEYQAPYQLGSHQIKREYFAIVHIGDGDGWDINRPCLSSIIMFQGKIYLVDAGPNIQMSLLSLGINFNEIEGIFQTHGHDDHFAGLSSLMRTDHRLKYFACPMVRASVLKKLAGLMSMEEERFSCFFDFRDLQLDVWNNIDGLEVKPLFSPHPVETSIFVFRALWDGGYKTYAHYSDIVSFDTLRKMVTETPEQGGVSRAFFEATKADYLLPATVKKVDAGGGMIHGQAEDFLADASKKIFFGHMARPLSLREREIGSNATFGAQDILVECRQEYSLQAGFNYLRAYFPTAPRHELHILLNCDLVNLSPGTIMIRKGAVPSHIYLVLNGFAEFIDADAGIRNVVSVGSFVGEISALMKAPETGTFRTTSYLRALQIPVELYRDFVNQNNLFAAIAAGTEIRQFMKRSWLFSDLVSYRVRHEIAGEMTATTLAAGETITPASLDARLFILRKGKMSLSLEGKFIETIGPGDFIGEESVLMGKNGREFCARCLEPAQGFFVAPARITSIPVILWKLKEVWERRISIATL